MDIVRYMVIFPVGFLFGDGSDVFPSGVFKTTDAGNTWEPMPATMLAGT